MPYALPVPLPVCVSGRTVLDPAAAGGNKNAKAMFGKEELAAILRCAPFSSSGTDGVTASGGGQ